ncbi:hypothetical protein M9458_016988, partial [Cirrhinus mrigala]
HRHLGTGLLKRPLIVIEVSSSCIRDAPQPLMKITHGGGWICKRFTDRKDCCADQINGTEIRIGSTLENNGNNNPICAVIPAIPAGESYNYSCGGMDGRYVNLIIPGDMKMLILCEVEVYGE